MPLVSSPPTDNVLPPKETPAPGAGVFWGAGGGWIPTSQGTRPDHQVATLESTAPFAGTFGGGRWESTRMDLSRNLPPRWTVLTTSMKMLIEISPVNSMEIGGRSSGGRDGFGHTQVPLRHLSGRTEYTRG